MRQRRWKFWGILHLALDRRTTWPCQACTSSAAKRCCVCRVARKDNAGNVAAQPWPFVLVTTIPNVDIQTGRCDTSFAPSPSNIVSKFVFILTCKKVTREGFTHEGREGVGKFDRFSGSCGPQPLIYLLCRESPAGERSQHFSKW